MNERPATYASPASPLPSDVRRPFALAGLAAIASTTFGSYAQDIAQWIVCGYGSLCNSADQQIEAIIFGVLAATVFAILSAVAASHVGTMKPTETIVTTLGATAGALLAILRAGARVGAGCKPSDDKCSTAWKLVDEPLFFSGIFIFIVVVPLLQFAFDDDGRAHTVRLYLRFVAALVLAGVIGAGAQSVAEKVWDDVSPSAVGASNFLVTAMASVMGSAGWAAVMLDPLIDREAWRGQFNAAVSFVTVYLCAAVAICVVYGLSLWQEGHEWRQAVPDPIAAAVVPLLVLPGVVACLLAALTGRRAFRGWRLAFGTLGAFVLGAACSVIVLCLLWDTKSDFAATPIDRTAFVVTHTLVSGLVVLSMAMTLWTLSRFGASRVSSPGPMSTA